MAHLEKQANDVKDREDLVPFTGEKRGMASPGFVCNMCFARDECGAQGKGCSVKAYLNKHTYLEGMALS